MQICGAFNRSLVNSDKTLNSTMFQVLMCPPDGCLATGCVGSLVTDKQPVVCGIDTINADIGQTYTLTFVVRIFLDSPFNSYQGAVIPCVFMSV